ncbi:hypothetical protein GCM10023178_19020 [Actinomadura luteofluorescens]
MLHVPEMALDAAHDLARFKQVQTLLRRWRLRAIAYARPDYEEAVQDPLEGREDTFVRYTKWTWSGVCGYSKPAPRTPPSTTPPAGY